MGNRPAVAFVIRLSPPRKVATLAVVVLRMLIQQAADDTLVFFDALVLSLRGGSSSGFTASELSDFFLGSPLPDGERRSPGSLARGDDWRSSPRPVVSR